MKILLVSMPSLHFFRWTDQLKDSGHEVYWFDILDGGKTDRLPWVYQITDWKQKYPNLKGRHFIKKRLSFIYKKLSFLIENNTSKKFEAILQEIKPDLVHSFVLQISCLPILYVMRKNHQINWAYSSWGSDLFNKSNKPNYDIDLKSVLCQVNFLFTDNLRDYNIALNNGFKGVFLGAFPGGGGFKYKQLDSSYFIPLEERKTILVKGYQGALGRSIEVLKALWLLKEKLQDYNIIVFGTDKEVIKFLNKNNYASRLSLQVFSKTDFLPHETILKLMGESLIYIGNSVSDGMPNTLLEAIIMGAFPIQSNPGGVTEEIIQHKKNGLLIYDCCDIETLKELIKTALTDFNLIKAAFHINQNSIKPIFDYDEIQKQVLQAYHQIN